MLLLCAFSTACVAGRMTLEELPEQPIAFVHWAEKSGQKRGEIFESAAEVPPLPPDEVGRIWVRGRSRAQGYWREAEKTAETFRGATPPIPTGSW